MRAITTISATGNDAKRVEREYSSAAQRANEVIAAGQFDDADEDDGSIRSEDDGSTPCQYISQRRRGQLQRVKSPNSRQQDLLSRQMCRSGSIQKWQNGCCPNASQMIDGFHKTASQSSTPANLTLSMNRRDSGGLDVLSATACATTDERRPCANLTTSPTARYPSVALPSIATIADANQMQCEQRKSPSSIITTTNISKIASEIATSARRAHLSDSDVLCGRGGMTNHHPGNMRFREMVRQLQPDYFRASKCHKSKIAKSIVDVIRTQDPPGRFLKKRDGKEGWFDIGDQKAREKTSQALREGAPDIRAKDVVSTMPGPSRTRITSDSSFLAMRTMIGK